MNIYEFTTTSLSDNLNHSFVETCDSFAKELFKYSAGKSLFSEFFVFDWKDDDLMINDATILEQEKCNPKVRCCGIKKTISYIEKNIDIYRYIEKNIDIYRYIEKKYRYL